MVCAVGRNTKLDKPWANRFLFSNNLEISQTNKMVWKNPRCMSPRKKKTVSSLIPLACLAREANTIERTDKVIRVWEGERVVTGGNVSFWSVMRLLHTLTVMEVIRIYENSPDTIKKLIFLC